LAITPFVAKATPEQCDVPSEDHGLQCNPYVKSRMCDLDKDEKNKWKSNSTHINIAIFKGLSGWQEFYKQDPDMAIMCAIDHAQAQGVLSDMIVEPVFADDESSESGGAKAALCMRNGGLDFAVGPFGSAIALNAGIIGKLFKINMIGTVTSSPLLSNKDPASGFPYFSRVFPSDLFQSKLVAEMAKQFNITKVATFSQSPQAYYDGIVNAFHSFAGELGMKTMSVTIPIDVDKETIIQRLQTIKSNGYRVIFLAAKQYNLTLTAAYELGMIGNDYVWFGTEELVGDSPLVAPYLLQGVSALVPALNTTSPHLEAFFNCIDEHKDDTTGKYAGIQLNADPKEIWFPFYYDAMHIMMRTIQKAKADNKLDDSDYFRSVLRNMSYMGATGTIEFDAQGDRVGAVYNAINFHYNEASNTAEKIELGVVDTKTMTMHLDFNKLQFYDKTNIAPKDYDIGTCTVENNFNATVTSCVDKERIVSYTPLNEDAERYCPSIPNLTIPCDYPTLRGDQLGTIITLVGLVLNIVLTIGVVIHQSHPIIIRSQKNMLFLMCFGGILGQLQPLLTGGVPTPVSCLITPTLISISYLLLFGPLFLKSYRVSALLNNKKMKVLKITDGALMRRLGVLLVINAVILVLMGFDDPPKPVDTVRSVSQPDGSWQTSVVDNRCRSTGTNYSTLLIFFLGMLMMYGCYVSFTIRNARSDLSEAKWIFIAIYNGAVWAFITCFLVFSVSGVDANGVYDFVAIGVTITSTATLILVLVPKFINIKNNVSVTDLSKSTAGTATSVLSSAPGDA